MRLENNEGQEVLSVEGAVVTLDLLGSVYNFSPRIWRLHLNGVSMQLSQDKQERWYLTQPRKEPSADAKKARSGVSIGPLDALLSARDVMLTDVVASYHFYSGRQHAFTFNEISLQNHEGFHRLNAAVDLPEQQNAVKVLLEGEGDLSNWREFSGSGYLQINNYKLRDSVAIASSKVSLWEGVVDTRVNADLWLDFVPDKAMTLKGTLQIMRPGGGKYAALPSWLDTNIWGAWHGLGQWQLQLQSLQFENDFDSGSGINLALQQMSDEFIDVYSPELDLGFWGQFVQDSALLPDRVEDILDTLQMHGYAKDLQVRIPLDHPADFQLQANLQDVGANAWQGSPQIAGLKGFLQLDKRSGSVQIDSHDYFLMHFPRVYHTPFEFHRAQGEVYWEFDRDANEVFINSGLLSMDGEIGKVRGYFLMDTPFFAKTRPSDFTLQIGLQDSEAHNHRYLVPYTAQESLLKWLDTAIEGGSVSGGGFFYRGSIRKDSKDKTMQLGLSIQQGQLAYSPGWPALKNFDAELVVDDRLLHGAVARGEFLDSQLSASTVSMFDNPQGRGSLLNITGGLAGPAQDILTVLTDTPLQKTVGKGFSQWQLQGDMTAQLDLDIPLVIDQPGMAQDISVDLASVDLNMQDTGLIINQLSGDLHFSDTAGLRSKQLRGALWQRPLDAVIETVTEGDAKQTRIHIKADMDMVDLANWSKRPEIKFTEGIAAVDGMIRIPFGGKGAGSDETGSGVSLEFSSDLNGVAVNLPAPFAKTPDDDASLSFRMEVGEGANRYLLNYNDLIYTDFLAGKQQAIQGEVSLLDKPTKNQRDGFFVTGHLEQLSEAELFGFIERYQGYGKTLPGSGSNAQTPASPLQFDAEVHKFVWGDLELEQVRIGGGQAGEGWRFQLENPWFKGELGLQDEQPIEVALDYLHIPDFSQSSTSSQATESEGEETALDQGQDFLEQLDLTQLQSMDISAREVTMAGENLGRWQFKLRPVDGGVELQDMFAVVRGVRLLGTDKDRGASLLWLADQNGHRSRFNGVIEATDLGKVMEQWQQPKLLESKRARMSADLSWQGSPVALGLVDLHGKAAFDVRKGRFFRSSANAESALLRLIGLFNFDSWVRRLQLDFSDVYKSGLAFDKITGETVFDQGMLLLEKPLVVETPSSELQMAGEIDLRNETLDASLVATLPVGGNATTAAAFLAGLPVAASVYLVSKLFDKQIKKLTSLSYTIEGPWASPQVKFDRLFDSNAAKKAGKKVREKTSGETAPVVEAEQP